MNLSRNLFISLKNVNISSTVNQVSRLKFKSLQLIKRNFQTVKQVAFKNPQITESKSEFKLIFKYGIFTIGVF